MNYEITENGIEFERSAGGNFIITCKFKKEEIAQLKRVIKDAERYWKRHSPVTTEKVNNK